MKKNKFLVIILTFIFFCFFGNLKLNANSALRVWNGNNNGVVCANKDVPIEVLNEDLTFNFYKNEDGSSFNLSAKYTFHNMADYDVNCNLLFPYGKLFNQNAYTNDTKYQILINDKEVTSRKRYSYDQYYIFEDYESLSKIQDDYIKNDYFDSTSKIYKYEIINKSDKRIVIKLDESIFSNYSSSFYIFENANIEIVTNRELNKDNFEIREDTTVIDNSVIEYNLISEVSFSDYIDSMYSSFKERYSDISKIDFYNAWYYQFLDYNKLLIDLEVGNLMSWYEYDLTIEKAATITNEIISPIYPDINPEYSPYIYSYKYLLSPAKVWKNFKSLNIYINTDMYSRNISLDGFIKTENGYEAHFDTLPQYELSFSFCESENPTMNYKGIDVISLIVILGLIAFLISFVIFIILYLFARKKAPNKGLRILYLLVGIITSIEIGVMFISLFANIEVNGILSILLIGALFVIYLIEYKRYKTPIKTRMIILIVYLVFVAILFIGSTTLIEALNNISLVGAVIALILYIMNIYYLFNKAGIGDVIIFKKEYKGSYYPVGYVNIGYLISAVVIIIIETIAFGVLYYNFENGFIILIFFIIMFVSLFINIILNSLSQLKPFSKYEKNLDFNMLVESVNKILENNKIHPETSNYLRMLLYQYAITVDLELANKLKNEIFEPNNKTYNVFYDLLSLNYLLTREEINNKIKELKNKYSKKANILKNIDKFSNWIDVYYDGKLKGSIDEIAPINTKSEYKNAIGLYYQIFYYRNNNNLDKASKLEALFKEKYSCLKVILLDIEGNLIRDEENGKNICPICNNVLNKDDLFCSKCGNKIK